MDNITAQTDALVGLLSDFGSNKSEIEASVAQFLAIDTVCIGDILDVIKNFDNTFLPFRTDLSFLTTLIKGIIDRNPSSQQFDETRKAFFDKFWDNNNADFVGMDKKGIKASFSLLTDYAIENIVDMEINHLISYLETIRRYPQQKSKLVNVVLQQLIPTRDLTAKQLIGIISSIPQRDRLHIKVQDIANLLEKFNSLDGVSFCEMLDLYNHVDEIYESSDSVTEQLISLQNKLERVKPEEVPLDTLFKLFNEFRPKNSQILNILLSKLIGHPELTPEKLISFIEPKINISHFDDTVQSRLYEILAEHPDTTLKQIESIYPLIYNSLIRRDIKSPLTGIQKLCFRLSQFYVLNDSKKIPTHLSKRFEPRLSLAPVLPVVVKILLGNSGLTWGSQKVPILDATSNIPGTQQLEPESQILGALRPLDKAWHTLRQ